MKNTVFPVVLLLCLFTTFLSCSNKPERSRKPVSSISLLPSKKNYVFGEKVSIRVETKVKNGEIKNIRLYYKNRLLKESKELDFTVENVNLNLLGTNNLSVVSTKTDDVSNTRTISVNVVSDIIPKQLTYQTINNFPHNNEFFTEGLEFHNGYIYEGTGENGKSGMYKTDLNSGKILQSFVLSEKYFGEGITILNDKIYQLTYHAQKGFVYNLSEFTRIDSFQYESKEGWGLTNDGTNLIMSNGSQFVTWINPGDYSVVKSVQVANNKGIINNVNELEYIDGTIYANVYGTDLIIQFDPETGKVLSEINLAGILNMYRNPSDKIDYMNGIAWDKTNKQLFVTGKWWPRLFEIKTVPLKQ